MTVMDGPEITGYVERVRAALADLPPEVRNELTEDLAEHLAEVAAEGEGSLVERLGEPEAYAEELRTAAGAGVPVAAPNLDRRLAATMVGLRTRLRAADRRAGPLLGHATASDFLRPLRPAWWLFRGYLVAMLITVMTTSSPGLLPRLGGSSLAGLLLLTVCVAGSLWLGRRTPTLSPWRRRAVGLSTGLLALFALVGFVDLDQRRDGDGYYYEPSSAETPYIRDVFVYDGQGRLVPGARLFDQDGNPIRLGDPYCTDGTGVQVEQEKPVLPTYPYCPSAAPFRFEAVPAAPAPTGPTPVPTGPTVPTEAPTGAPAPTPAPTAPTAPVPTPPAAPSVPASPGAGVAPAPPVPDGVAPPVPAPTSPS
jgi:hypothetical protein